MKRFLIGAAVLVLLTAGAETASARGHSNHSSNFIKPAYSAPGQGKYFQKYPVSSKSFNGYYYKGKNSFFWNRQCWYPSYGCYLYWNPCYNCYYYWCAPDDCYYPISYCPYSRYAW